VDFSALEIALVAFASLLVGVSKTGITGLGVLIVPIMADVFGARASVGVLLPMLVFADLFAVAWYRRHARWGVLARLLPWTLPGLALGFCALKWTPEDYFRPFLGALVLVMLGGKLLMDRFSDRLAGRLPHTWWFSAVVGVLAGFATMAGNVAGALMSIYLISMGMKKQSFLGTGAWYYLIINALKAPFHARLELITATTLLFNLKTVPLIVAGAFLGRFILRVIPQKWFTRAVLVLAAAGALRLLLW